MLRKKCKHLIRYNKTPQVLRGFLLQKKITVTGYEIRTVHESLTVTKNKHADIITTYTIYDREGKIAIAQGDLLCPGE